MSENTDLPNEVTEGKGYLRYLQTTTEASKPLTEVESKFIRKEIRERDFASEDNRKYIAHLVKLEQYVLGELDEKLTESPYIGKLTSRRPAAYDRIQQELDPEAYRNRKREEREQRQRKERENQSEHKRTLAELREFKREWDAVENEGKQE